MTEKQIDAAADAARHLIAEGLPPLLSLKDIRALWRRGGKDRVLAEHLGKLVGAAGNIGRGAA